MFCLCFGARTFSGTSDPPSHPTPACGEVEPPHPRGRPHRMGHVVVCLLLFVVLLEGRGGGVGGGYITAWDCFIVIIIFIISCCAALFYAICILFF